MPDIQLRFHHDMLVLSGPVHASLEKQGIEVAGQLELLDLTEPESVEEALRLEHLAGAQCLLAPAADITQARLAHQRLDEHADQIAQTALGMAKRFRPQHVIAEINATGLPIDPTSRPSLTANRDQYSDAVRAFGEDGVDAFFLNGMEGVDDVRCGCMGVRKASSLPLFCSVDVDAEGGLVGRGLAVERAIEVMEEYEANVVGIRTDAAPDAVAGIVRRIASVTDLPVLVQLVVEPEKSRLPRYSHESPYWHPDTMLQAAIQLRAAGAQFLRAVGNATPTYTGALVAATMGTSCVR
ncbi:MAG: methionine synthase [Eggerthellaceae bacterium]|nr:methionine synthase [Eggerthellaceae bacterium]